MAPWVVPMSATEPNGSAAPLTWVIGAGGLLGSAVCRHLQFLGLPFRTTRVPWSEPEKARAVLLEEAATLARSGEPWRIAWCAGAGVIGSSQHQLDDDLRVFRTFLDDAETEGMTAFFLASSAGGVYAGSADPPFSEATEPRPISPYGDAKLAAEQAATAWAERSGVPLVIGRIANLYGPGQDISKPQGLISQLCFTTLQRRPLSIYVSLDTARDYVFIDDAAAAVIGCLDRVVLGGRVVVKILASQRPTTVAVLLGELRRLTRRRPLVVLGSSPHAKFQVKDLRFVSNIWPDVDAMMRTPLTAGVGATLHSVGRDVRESGGTQE